MSGRFTLDGSTALEAELAAIGEAVRARVTDLAGRDLEAILLGGGYGRGEGGVWRSAAGDRPYNDLEFYVLFKHPVWLAERRYGSALRTIAAELSETAGIEIELKAENLGRIRRSGTTMFWYDLVMGHRWIVGGEELLEGMEHHQQACAIPLEEATRLLMNRCSGLLFTQERLAREVWGDAEADFVGRNLAKAQLGFGDAVLAALGQYHWSCRERHRRLEKLLIETEQMAWLGEVKREHCAGLMFKLHPQPRQETRAFFQQEWRRLKQLGEQVWLWLEARRLGRRFATAREYALAPVNLCAERPRWKNPWINVRSFGWRAVWSRAGWRYPRERLLRSMALMLWVPTAMEEAACQEVLRRTLVADPPMRLAEVVQAYERIWNRFN